MKAEKEATQAMRSEAGFTLIELLIAVAILAVGLIGTLSMHSTALQADSFAQRTTSASGVARAAMDELLSRPGSDVLFRTATVNPAPGDTFDLDPQSIATTLAVQGITYSATIQVFPNAVVNGTSITDLTALVLTVVGNDVSSIAPPRTVTLTELKRAL